MRIFVKKEKARFAYHLVFNLQRLYKIFISNFCLPCSVTSATLCDGIVASERATFSTPFARLGNFEKKLNNSREIILIFSRPFAK
jgi:enoyl-CoA hydratase/carnithine racemase